VHVGHVAGVCVVSGRGVGGGVVGGGGVGRRVRGVVIRAVDVGWDGRFINAAAETDKCKVGQDPLYNVMKMSKVITVTLKTLNFYFTICRRMF